MTSRLAELEQEIARLRERLSVLEPPALNYNRTLARAEKAEAEVDRLRRERDALREAAFKAGWASGYYDGGEHDCRMFTPTAERGWDDYKREHAALAPDRPEER